MVSFNQPNRPTSQAPQIPEDNLFTATFGPHRDPTFALLRAYYARAQEVAKYILSVYKLRDLENWNEASDASSRSLVPNGRQIEPGNGLAISFQYNRPCCLVTPLGSLPVGGSGMWRVEAFNEIKRNLGLVRISPELFYPEETVGPIYAVTRDHDGTPRPTAKLVWHPKRLNNELALGIWQRVHPHERKPTAYSQKAEQALASLL